MDLNNLKFFDVSSSLFNQIVEVYSTIYDFFSRDFRDVLLDMNNEVATTLEYLLGLLGADGLLEFSLTDLIFGAGLLIVIVATVARWVWDTFNPFN